MRDKIGTRDSLGLPRLRVVNRTVRVPVCLASFAPPSPLSPLLSRKSARNRTMVREDARDRRGRVSRERETSLNDGLAGRLFPFFPFILKMARGVAYKLGQRCPFNYFVSSFRAGQEGGKKPDGGIKGAEMGCGCPRMRVPLLPSAPPCGVRSTVEGLQRHFGDDREKGGRGVFTYTLSRNDIVRFRERDIVRGTKHGTSSRGTILSRVVRGDTKWR